MRYLFLVFALLPKYSISEDSFMDIAQKLINLDPVYQGKLNENGFQVAALNASKSQLFLPSIDFNFGRYKDLILVTNQEATFLRSSLDISYNLFNFGSDYNSFQASKAILSSYHAELESIKIEREKIIFKLLFDYISLKKQIEIYKQLKDLKLSVLKLSQKKYKLGRISKMELLKFDLDIANTNSQIIDRKQQLLDIYDRINGYINDNNRVASIRFPWVDIASEKLIQNIAHLDINDVSVPSLEKLRFEKSALEKDYISEKRKHMGRINLNYSRSYLENDDNDSFYAYSASIVYNLPIFEKFSRKQEVSKRKALLVSKEFEYRYEKNLLHSQAKSMKKKLKFSFENFVNRNNLLSISQKLFKFSESEYRKGRLSANQLLVERNRLLDTTLLTISASYNLHMDIVNTLHTYGKSVTDNLDYLY